jgi:hypothetical protein
MNVRVRDWGATGPVLERVDDAPRTATHLGLERHPLPSGALAVCLRGRPAWLVCGRLWISRAQLGEYERAIALFPGLPDLRRHIAEFRAFLKEREPPIATLEK